MQIGSGLAQGHQLVSKGWHVSAVPHFPSGGSGPQTLRELVAGPSPWTPVAMGLRSGEGSWDPLAEPTEALG